MPDARMAPIEILRIHPIYLAHAGGEIGGGRFHHQMVMVLHQTIGVTNPLEACYYLLKQIKETPPVGIVAKNGHPGVSTGGHVIDRPSIFNA